jgi:hypothetical protein
MKPRFTLVIESVPHEVPVVNRLRRLLKAMLRGYGLRCVAIQEIEPTEPIGRARRPP